MDLNKPANSEKPPIPSKPRFIYATNKKTVSENLNPNSLQIPTIQTLKSTNTDSEPSTTNSKVKTSVESKSNKTAREAVTYPISPFLTESSVPEEISTFERCSGDLLLAKGKHSPPVQIKKPKKKQGKKLSTKQPTASNKYPQNLKKLGEELSTEQQTASNESPQELKQPREELSTEQPTVSNNSPQEPDSFYSDECIVYDILPGTSNYGSDFEYKMCFLVALNSYFDENVQDFRISNNAQNFGKFDDVVLELTYKNQEKHIILIQLKYLSGPIKPRNFSNNGYFDLWKYNPPENVFRGIQNIKYFLYTNADTDLNSMQLFIKKLGQNILNVELLSETENDDILDKVCYKSGKIFKISSNQEEEKEKGFNNFLKNLYFCTDQYDVPKLDQELKSVLSKHLVGFEVKEEINKICDFFKSWWMVSDRRIKIQRKDVALKLGLTLLERYIPEFQELKQIGNTESIEVFNEMLMKYELTLCYPFSKTVFGILLTDFKTIENVNEWLEFLVFNIISDNLSMSQIYLRQWIYKNVPLVIRFDKKEDWELVKIAIKMCREYDSFHFILSGPIDRSDVIDLSSNILNDLEDLRIDPDLLEKVLRCFKFRPNNRGPFTLNKVFGNDAGNLKEVTIHDCLLVIEDKVETSDLINYYIPRRLPRLVATTKIFDEITEDLIIVGCRKAPIFNLNRKEISLNDFLYDSKIVVTDPEKVVITQKESITNFELITIKQKKFHYFEMLGKDQFEWIFSNECAITFSCSHDSSNCVADKHFFENFKNDCNIILADPGMGKTIFLDYLVENCPSHLWPIKVLVRTHFKFLSDKNNISVDKIINFLIETIKDERWKRYARQLNSKRNLIILWDGLDEFPLAQLKILMKMILTLQSAQYKQIVTSRYFMKERLEDTLNLKHLTVLPFNIEEQLQFVDKILEHSEINESNKENVKMMIRNSVNVKRYNEILGIPLQLYIFTEVYVSSELQHEDTKKIYNLSTIYQRFIDGKIKVFAEKNNLDALGAYKKQSEFYKEILQEYEMAAVVSFLGHELCELDKKALRKFQRKLKNREFENGIIINFTDEYIPIFFHNTFAEYLVAKFLMQNCLDSDLSHSLDDSSNSDASEDADEVCIDFAMRETKLIIKDVLNDFFNPKYKTVRYFFDLLLAQGHPAHIYFLNEFYDEMLQNIEQLDLCDTDKGNRSLLHLACSWGQPHPKLEKNDNGEFVRNDFVLNENPSYTKILIRIIEKCDLNLKDDILQKSSIDCVFGTQSLFELEILIKQNKYQFTDSSRNYIPDVIYYAVICNDRETLEKIELTPLIFELGNTLIHLASICGHSEIVKFLIQKGANVNQQNKFGATPLYVAIHHEHYNLVCELIDLGGDIKICDNYGWSTLHVACHNGNLGLVKLLVNKGFDLNHCNNGGRSPFYATVLKEDLELIRYLAEIGVDVNKSDNDGWSPFYVACLNENLDLVKLLFETGVDVEQVDNEGRSPFYAACSKGHLEVINFLIENKIDMNKCDNQGLTPFHASCLNENLDLIKLLSGKGADINKSDHKEQSPFFAVCVKGNLDLVKLLIEIGVDINKSNSEGRSPLYEACFRRNLELVKLLAENGADVTKCNNKSRNPFYEACLKGNLDLIEVLIKNGVDINKSDFGRSPFFAACVNGNLELIKLLFKYKADVNKCDYKNQSPFFAACRKGRLEVIKFLIEIKVDINVGNNQGQSPFFAACLAGNFELIKLLLANGVDVNLCDKEERSPLLSACMREKIPLVKLLINNGADVNKCNNEGRSPFFVACVKENLELINLLFEAGADANKCDNEGWSPFYVSCFGGNAQVLRLLYGKGVDINKCDNRGRSPFFLTCLRKKLELIILLIRSGVDFKKCDNEGNSPLIHLLSIQDPELTNLLAERGIELNN